MKGNKKIRGANLVYEEHGQGEVILFIHGQPFNRTMWKYQLQEFSSNHRLIIPDLRGYGESDIPEKITLLDELALDLIYLLDDLKIKKAIVIGLSMGGQIALEMYALRPGLFKALILADTDSRAEDEAGYKNRIELSQRILHDGMDKFTSERIHHFLCKGTFLTKPNIVAHLTEMMTSTSSVGSSVVQRGRAERRDCTPLLSHIDFPVLVIVGRDDEFTPVDTAKFIQSHIAGGELAIIEDAGHIPNMEQSENFNNIIRRFLMSHDL